MKFKRVIFCLLSLSVTLAYGSGFQSLQLGADGRSSGMGMVSTALDLQTGGYNNPATLAGGLSSHFQISTLQWIEDVQSHFVSFARCTPDQGIGFHFLYTAVDNIEHRLVASVEPIGTFSSHELVGGLSYGKKINPQFAIGGTVHALYEKLFVNEAWGVAIDLGMVWQRESDGLKVAASLNNLGKTGELESTSIPLPFTFKTGVARPFQVGGGQLLAAADLVAIRDDGLHTHWGLEYAWTHLLFVRGGYQTGYELRSFTGGLGIAWHAYRFDYSYLALGADFNDSHRISFTVAL